MSDRRPVEGRCLCGAVRVAATTLNPKVGACHCGMCRHWGGGPLMAVDCGTDVQYQGKEHIGVFDSSPWAERGFCRRCGSHLFYRIKQSGQTIMSAGLFDEAEFVFDHQVFIDEKPAYYRFVNVTQDMTGAEVFSKYGSQSE